MNDLLTQNVLLSTPIHSDNRTLNTVISQLFTNQKLSFEWPNFATQEECQLLAKALLDIGFDNYLDVNPPIGRIGVTQYEAKKMGKDWYFEKVLAEQAKQKLAFSRSFDPINRLLKYLKHIFPNYRISIAAENDQQSYYAGLVRQINDTALIHADFARYDGQGWNIAEVTAQLAFNLCVAAPIVGGECVVHDKQWQLDEDEKYRLPDSYGYARSVVANKELEVIKPIVGQSYFFNSRNFHEVLSGDGNRMTVSCFIGLTADQQILIWS